MSTETSTTNPALTTPTTRKDKWKQILKIAWPLIIANSFWNIQMTVDRVFLGSFSTEALGAAMAVMGVFWTPMALLQQTSAYVTTFIAQYFGSKEYKMIGAATWQAIYISAVGGLFFLGFMFFSKDLFVWIGHSPLVQELEVQYFNAMCFSALPTALVAAFSGFYTGLGQTQKVMWINGVGLVVNVIFNYLLIFGNFGFPQLGAAGAGYATSIANLAAAMAGFYMVFNNRNEKIYGVWSSWKLNWDLFKRYIRFGVPSGLQWALEGLAFTVFLIVLGRTQGGDAALAASSIAVTVMMLAVLPALGVAQAVLVLVGQHLGNKKPELAEDSAWSGVQVSAMYMAFVAVLFLAFPQFFLSWFENKTNAELWSEVSRITPYLLMFVSCFTVFDSMTLNFSFALKGAGDTKYVSLVALLVPWPVMVLPTFLVSDWPGSVFWSWGAATIYSTVLATIFWRRFKGGRWKTMSVIH